MVLSSGTRCYMLGALHWYLVGALGVGHWALLLDAECRCCALILSTGEWYCIANLLALALATNNGCWVLGTGQWCWVLDTGTGFLGSGH